MESTTIDLDKISAIAKMGINRAYVFMGFATNLAEHPDLDDFEVTDGSFFSAAPKNLTNEERTKLKQEFVAWVVANGLREIIEHFDVFLDRLFEVAISIDVWKARKSDGIVDEQKVISQSRKFERLGTSQKLERLGKDFEIIVDFGDEISTVKKARNCYTHRLGFVDRTDLTDHEAMEVCWRSLELYGYNPDGSEFVPAQDVLPMVFPENSPVMYRNQERCKRFRHGEYIEFSSTELKEICYTFSLAIDSARKSIAAFAATKGVTVNYL